LVPVRSEEEVEAAERVCAFCGELAPGRLFAKGPPPVAICPACRVWSRTALQTQLLGLVRCGFCTRLRPAGGMIAVAESRLEAGVGICNECLDFCDEFTNEELYG
jgi:hypothetical protein